MENEDFGNRPFEKLAQTRKGAQKPSDDAQTAQDRELFLREVWKETPKALQSIGGFLLSDQCRLPKVKMKKKKKLQPEGRPVASQIESEELAEDLFAVAMRNTIPLSGKGRAVVPAVEKMPAVKAKDLSMAEYLDSKLEFAISSSDEYMEGYVVGLDPLIMGRLRQGQFSPEAHLDMHGLNAEQAFEALKEFMRQAWYKGLHAVLIIPGRGRNSTDGFGILRQRLPYWLTHEPFKRVVLGFCTAQPHDGGPGSIYVLLRKSRKKGPIRWEMLAFDSD